MADEPIRSGEFNRAMGSLRDHLDRMEKGQDSLRDDVSKLFELHRSCLSHQNSKAYEEGRISGRLQALEDRTSELEEQSKASTGAKRQLGIGFILSAITSAVAIGIAFWKHK